MAGGSRTLVVLGLVVVLAACSSPHASKAQSTSPTSTTSSTSTTMRAQSPSPPLARGSPVPGFLVKPISFISETQGYGLYEYNTSSDQQLVATTNGGATWAAATVTPLPVFASDLEFVDDETGYAWGQDELEVTHDGGEHWTNSLEVPSANQTVSAVGMNIWAIDSSGFLEMSSDGGSTWQKNTTVPVANVVFVSLVSPTTGFVFGCGAPRPNGTAIGNLARTEDGGQSWQSVQPPECQTSKGVDLVATSPEDLWLIEFGVPATDMSSKWVYRSNDGGTTWSLTAAVVLGERSQDTGQISANGGFGPLVTFASAPDLAWLSEDRNGLLETTDEGLTWSPAFNNADVADALGPPYLSFLDSTHGWAATGDGLWRTTNGIDWTDIAPAPSP